MSGCQPAPRPVKGRRLIPSQPDPRKPIMNARNANSRIASLIAAVAMTTLTLGSQFGLAGHYSAKANAVMAAKQPAPVAQTTATAAPQRKG
jgi:hypothetical protein